MIKYLLCVFISFIVTGFCCYIWRYQSIPCYIVLELKSKANTDAQIYVDYGNGFNEFNSIIRNVKASKDYQDVYFPLEPKCIYQIRFDPFIADGEMLIKSIEVYCFVKELNKINLIKAFNTKELIALNNVQILDNNSKNVTIKTENGKIDPNILLPISSKLDLLSFEDIFDKQFYLQFFSISSFLSIIMISIIIKPNKNKRKIDSIDFVFQEKIINHKKGNSIYLNKSNYIYRDTTEDNIDFIINEIQKTENWKSVINKKYSETNPWLYKIITSNKRTKFIDDFISPTDSLILDIGAGWGQFSIPLGKDNFVCSLEPSHKKLNFIKELSKKENVKHKMFLISADYFDVSFKNKFDLILCIGVLEWVGCYNNMNLNPETVQLEFLKKAFNELREDGKIIIGIENRLGLKYLLGTNDDHCRLPHISYYKNELAKRKYIQKTNSELLTFTYSIAEYKELLQNCGFKKIKFYAAFPDYKIPELIFPISNDTSFCEFNNYILQNGFIYEHDGSNGENLLIQEELKSLYYSYAEMNIAHLFAPSYYIEAYK